MSSHNSGSSSNGANELPSPDASSHFRFEGHTLGPTASSPFHRGSAPPSSHQWWQFLETQPRTRPKEQSTVLERAARTLRRSWTRGKMAMKLVTWPIFLFFALCWLCLGIAACTTAYTWAVNIESMRKDNAVHIASELARFLGTETERFFVPLYPLRLFVERTRLIQLSRIAQDFPDRDSGTNAGVFKNVSSLNAYPEVLADFEETMEGIWGALDTDSKGSTMSIQLTPGGVITLVSPLEGNAEVVGMDVLHESRSFAGQVRAAVGRDSPSVIGPTELIQGGQGILAYLPVYVDEEVDGLVDTSAIPGVTQEGGQGKRFWGFATAVANLTKMQEWSGALRDFRYAKMHFEMVRDSHRGGPEETSNTSETYHLSRSDDGKWSVGVRVPRINWELTVGWDEGFWPQWYWGTVAAAIVVSWVVAVLLTCVLIGRRKHRMLLYRIMPPTVVKALRQGRQVVQHFDNVTIFFSDLVGFTDLSSRRTPLEVVALLNQLYTDFDSLAHRHKVFKSDTMGDAYMVVGGAPEQCGGPEGAARVARFALDALDLIAEADEGISMRAGLASGPAVAAVLGTSMPKYAFFGETVNTSNVMESSGRAGALQVTEATKQLLEQSGIPLLFSEVVDTGSSSRSAAAGKTFWVKRKEPPTRTKAGKMSLRAALRKRRALPGQTPSQLEAGRPESITRNAAVKNSSLSPLPCPLPDVATAHDAATTFAAIEVDARQRLDSRAGPGPTRIRVDS